MLSYGHSSQPRCPLLVRLPGHLPQTAPAQGRCHRTSRPDRPHHPLGGKGQPPTPTRPEVQEGPCGQQASGCLPISFSSCQARAHMA